MTADNELSLAAPGGTLAFRGTVEIAKGGAVRESFVPSRSQEGCYHCKCNNENTTSQ